jgi:DNA-binding NtrC family response regulator
MMTDSDSIDVADLPESLHNPPPRSHPDQVEFVPMSVVERRHAAAVLAAVNGNKVQAAKILGIHRTTLARLLHEEGPDGITCALEEDGGALAPVHHAG